MKNGLVLIFAAAAVLLSVSVCNACEDIRYEGSLTSAAEAETDKPVYSLRALRSEAVSYAALDTLVPVCLYTRDGRAETLVYHANSGELPPGLTYTLLGITAEASAEKTGTGIVYQPVAGNIAVTSDRVGITFSSDGASHTFDDVPVAEVVEGAAGEWETTADGHRLTRYKGSEKNIVVPNHYGGIPIISLGGDTETTEDGSFYINIAGGAGDTLTGAVISEGIINICPCAFYGTSTLKTVTLPKTTEKLYQAAFADCTGLTGTLELPPRLVLLDDYAFFGCKKLTGGLTVPPGVERIGEAAFYNCSGFNGALVLSEGVRETGGLAFGGSGVNMHFTSLSLPSTLKCIGSYTFQYCVDIDMLTLPEGLEVISDGAFDHMQGIKNESLAIPASVHTIGGDYLVDTNTGYGGHVFYDMGKNESFAAFTADGNPNFTVRDGVLFSADMTRLIAYPRGKTDGTYTLPEGITQLDELSFSRNPYLKTLVLPDSYTVSTEVPANILNQDGNTLAAALYVYTGIENIAVSDKNPNYTAVDGILYSKDRKTLVYLPNNHRGDAEIEDGCETILQGAFYAVAGNTAWGRISLPPSVRLVSASAAEYLNECIRKNANVSAAASGIYTVNANGFLFGPYAKGDADLSGTVDAADAAVLLKMSAGGTPEGISEVNADINGSGRTDILDAVCLLKNE